MRRLLRGKAFYILLTCFVIGVFYHGQVNQVPPWMPPPVSNLAEEPTDEEWWTEDIDADALRASVASDPFIQIVFLLLMFFAVAMSVGGLTLLIWAAVTGRLWRLWQGPTRRPPPWTMGEFWRIMMLIVLLACLLQYSHVAIAAVWPQWYLDPNLWINVSMLLLHTILLIAVMIFAMDKSDPPLHALGLSRATLSRALSVGFRGYVAIFPWLVVLLVGIVGLANYFEIEPPSQPIHEMIFAEERPAVLGLTILLTCVVGPVTEEVFFRGVFFGALRQRTSRWVAMFVSGAFFSLVHTNLIGFIPIMVLGCLLADLYERTGSLASPIAVHILHNTFLLTVALAFRWAI